MTAPSQVAYEDVLRVRREADSVPQIEHAWLFDHLPVSYHQPGSTQGAITEATDAGFRHIVLGLASPYPAEVAHWVAETFIGPAHCPR
jgi:hypothetical protein